MHLQNPFSRIRAAKTLPVFPLVIAMLWGAYKGIVKWRANEPEWSYFRSFATQPLALVTGPDEKLFGYLPGTKALLAPIMAIEPYGYFIFLALSLSCVVILYRILVTNFISRDINILSKERSGKLFWISCCMAGPSYLALQNNQLVTFSAVMAILSIHYLLIGKKRTAAMFLAMATMFKTLPILLIPMLILSKQWRTASFSLLILALGSLLFASLTDGVPSSIYHHIIWPYQVSEQNPLELLEGDIPYSFQANQSFLAYKTRFFIFIEYPTLAYIYYPIAAVVFVLLCIATLKTHLPNDHFLPLAAIWLSMLIFASPFGRYYYMLFHVPLWTYLGCVAWRSSPLWQKAKWIFPISSLIMLGHNPVFAIISTISVVLGIVYFYTAVLAKPVIPTSKTLYPSIIAKYDCAYIISSVLAICFTLLFLHFSGKPATTSLDEFLKSYTNSKSANRGSLMVLASQRTFDQSSYSYKATLISSPLDKSFQRNLSDIDNGDIYIVHYSMLHIIDKSNLPAILNRIDSNEDFVVYNEQY